METDRSLTEKSYNESILYEAELPPSARAGGQAAVGDILSGILDNVVDIIDEKTYLAACKDSVIADFCSAIKEAVTFNFVNLCLSPTMVSSATRCPPSTVPVDSWHSGSLTLAALSRLPHHASMHRSKPSAVSVVETAPFPTKPAIFDLSDVVNPGERVALASVSNCTNSTCWNSALKVDSTIKNAMSEFVEQKKSIRRVELRPLLILPQLA